MVGDGVAGTAEHGNVAGARALAEGKTDHVRVRVVQPAVAEQLRGVVDQAADRRHFRHAAGRRRAAQATVGDIVPPLHAFAERPLHAEIVRIAVRRTVDGELARRIETDPGDQGLQRRGRLADQRVVGGDERRLAMIDDGGRHPAIGQVEGTERRNRVEDPEADVVVDLCDQRLAVVVIPRFAADLALVKQPARLLLEHEQAEIETRPDAQELGGGAEERSRPVRLRRIDLQRLAVRKIKPHHRAHAPAEVQAVERAVDAAGRDRLPAGAADQLVAGIAQFGVERRDARRARRRKAGVLEVLEIPRIRPGIEVIRLAAPAHHHVPVAVEHRLADTR